MRHLILLSLLLLGSSSLWAQTSLLGKVIDADNEEGLPLVNMALIQDDNQIAVTSTDIDGNYNFSNLKVGTYKLMLEYFGYPSKTLVGIKISTNETKILDIEMSSTITIDEEVVVIAESIIDPGKNIGGATRDADFIKNNPERGIAGAVLSTATVNALEPGEAVSSGGSRTTSNLTLVNGIPVIGGAPIADLEIEEIQIMTSGIPAQYGNATGSITNIITKGPSSRFSGGVQIESSQLTDNFGENTINGYFSGPIIAKPMINALGDTTKVDGRVAKSTILGYRFSGAYFTTKDPRPSALSTFKIKEEKLKEILENPLIANPGGSGSVFASDFLTEDDLEETNVRSNARTSYGQYSGTIEYQPSQDFFLKIGSEGRFSWGNSAAPFNQLFNYDFNPEQKSNNLGFNASFRHIVSSTIPGNTEEDEKNSTRLQPIFQNLSYELIGSYNQTNFESIDPRYKDRLWEYGYVGKFYESRRPVIDVVDSLAIVDSNGDIIGYQAQVGHASFFNSFDGYEPNWDINPGLAAYNNLLAQPNSFDPDAPTSLNEMEMINGLNTGARGSAYGLFSAPHLTGAGFGKSNTTQARGNVQVNFDLVTNQKSGNPMRHQVQLGGTFEQRVERSYNINPFDLWNLAYQSTNSHISNATDRTRPTGENYYDPFSQRNYQLYDALIRTDAEGNEVAMSEFGKNLREALGFDKRDWVSVHELTPDQMELDWFEPTTLVTGTQRVVNYYGYDYKGNPLGTNVSFNDFFTATDENGIKTRPVAPFKPIYMAGYIQDKFVYKDIICNFGVRFDSYDANTSVLKDPYSITGYETAAEFESDNSLYDVGQTTEYRRPSNIEDNFAVYVNQNSSDASVVGYRNGEQWYNAEGIPVNTPSELGANFIPALKGIGTSQIDPQGNNYDPSQAFRDYTPSIIIMPRISLSFPISPESNFYANYDILSQRPPVGSYASALDYYNFREITTSDAIINNPNLRPERTINYEVGFQQALTKYSKIKVSMVYKEERDLIQARQYINAYPNTYTTYGNDDFSTTKAFKLEYETLRYKNLQIIANYALQFTEGTGSNPTSSRGVAAEELKYVFALDFDQRHTFYANIDYRFSNGKDYNGPKIGHFDVLENTGLSVSVNANSGRPYTKKQIPGGLGTSFRNRITEGSINGARVPWNFRVGMKLDRNFVIGKKSKNPMYLNVYLRITNLFNTQNVHDVYVVTGSPSDDGFLTTANSPGPGFASSQPASYEMLYNLNMNTPFNISRPRRIFLGLSFAF